MDNVTLQYQSKMIINALKAGWTVSMNSKQELEFTKNKHTMSKQELDEAGKHGFSSKFLKGVLNDDRA